MSMKSETAAKEGTPTYLESGDTGLRRSHSLWSWSTAAADKYHPVWVESLADDVTLEGSAMNGAVQGADAVRSIVTYIRTLYDSQEVNYAGPFGENGFLEDYTAVVRGEPLGNVVLITRNPAGQAQHIVAFGNVTRRATRACWTSSSRGAEMSRVSSNGKVAR